MISYPMELYTTVLDTQAQDLELFTVIHAHFVLYMFLLALSIILNKTLKMSCDNTLSWFHTELLLST